MDTINDTTRQQVESYLLAGFLSIAEIARRTAVSVDVVERVMSEMVPIDPEE